VNCALLHLKIGGVVVVSQSIYQGHWCISMTALDTTSHSEKRSQNEITSACYCYYTTATSILLLTPSLCVVDAPDIDQ
jgi:hypothetical protein